jgi:hypothetical protein
MIPPVFGRYPKKTAFPKKALHTNEENPPKKFPLTSVLQYALKGLVDLQNANLPHIPIFLPV